MNVSGVSFGRTAVVYGSPKAVQKFHEALSAKTSTAYNDITRSFLLKQNNPMSAAAKSGKIIRIYSAGTSGSSGSFRKGLAGAYGCLPLDRYTTEQAVEKMLSD